LPPVHQQAYKSTIHLDDPRQPKLNEENIPNGTSNLTMKQKMVHRLHIPST
jgi:hypothetical protein